MTHTAEELGAKMDALGVWSLLEPFSYLQRVSGNTYTFTMRM